MFDRLDDTLMRYEEMMNQLSEPDVANDPERFKRLMKEQSDLTPIVEAYKEYKQCKQNVEDSLAMLDEESDEEMRELAKEELNESKARIEELEQESVCILSDILISDVPEKYYLNQKQMEQLLFKSGQEVREKESTVQKD